LLGGGMSSRLFQEVREKRGLVYSIHTFSSSYTDTGIFGVYAGTGEAEAEEMMPVICDEVLKVADTLDAAEVARSAAQ
jgi:predicted Zn-dependent peptidase